MAGRAGTWEGRWKKWSLRLITGSLLLWGPISLWAILMPMAMFTAPKTSASEVSSPLSLLSPALLAITSSPLALLALISTLLALMALLLSLLSVLVLLALPKTPESLPRIT